MISKTNNPIAIALYSVNNHAKNAPNLYVYKDKTIEKLLLEKKAQKIGYQRIGKSFFTLVQYQDFYFHTRSTKEDLKTLTPIAYQYIRNPKCYMSIKVAKQVLANYIGLKPTMPKKHTDSQMIQYTFYR